MSVKMYSRPASLGPNSPDLHRGPAMYTCASRVKMPQLGADEGHMSSRPAMVMSLDRPVLLPPSLPSTVSDQYVKTISGDLNFDETVVRDRCFHTLPYDEKYFKEALDISDIVPQPPKTRYTMVRYNKRGPDKRHAPCHLQKRATHKLKPLRRKILEKASEMHKQALDHEAMKLEQQTTEAKSTTDYQNTDMRTFFLTETSTVPPPSTARTAHYSQEMSTSNNWDEYLLSILSEDTAHWIASHQSDPHYNQDRLKSFIKDRHGFVDMRAELVKDDASEVDFHMGPDENSQDDFKKKWRRPDETLLDRVREVTNVAQNGPTDPYDDDTSAAFYRLPAGFRQAKKAQDKEEDAACNSTAFNIDVRRFEPPPPPTIRDFINPKVGAHMYDTENPYQQEWLTGGKQIYKKHEDKDRIFMNNNKYKKVLQKDSPRKPNEWFPLSSRETNEKEKKKKSVKVVEKGLHRWKNLPEPVDDIKEGKIKAPEEADPRALFKENAANEVNLAADPIFNRANGDKNTERFFKTKTTLTKVVNDWRSKWHLDMRYADATPEDLIRDMADIHPHIRLKAITTCARAAEYKPPPEQGISLQADRKIDYVKLLPENLFVALECCLEDKHVRVGLAASIALYTLERPNKKAEVILRKALNQQGGSVDRWAAAQCLAFYGECDSEVVGELVYQLLEAEDSVRHQQAAELLALLSENSTLVHSMIAEQLNSSSWRHRVMACIVIPKLQGTINKDLVHKLAHLMWHDWHKEVRRASAQTLGRTGHGKDVHDELLEKMTQGNEKNRVEAVSKVGHLGIMTAKLLPIFLQCFHDQYVSVRIEACIASSNLKINDPNVLEKLIFAATYDPIWKVKALAIQAMGSIKHISQQVRETVLWAFRFEGVDGVRAEACEAIMQLGMNDPEVVGILQDRYLVETSDIVKDKLEEALEMFGISATEDMDMVAQIKGEVRKLCTKSKIALQITVNELEDEQRENRARMIYKDPEEKIKDNLEEQRYRPFSQSSLTSRNKMATSALDMGPGIPRPISRDSSVVDREIQEIFEQAKRGRLTPETLSQYTESRPTTGVSKKNEDIETTDKENRDVEEEIGEVASLPPSRPVTGEAQQKALMESTPIDPNMGQTPRRETQDSSDIVKSTLASGAQQKKEKSNFSDKQSYVGIRPGGDKSSQDPDVITLQHQASQDESQPVENDILHRQSSIEDQHLDNLNALQQQSVEGENQPIQSEQQPQKDPHNTSITDDGFKTPKTMGTTDAMFVQDGEDTHDLSDSFTLPGSILDTQSQVDTTVLSQGGGQPFRDQDPSMDQQDFDSEVRSDSDTAVDQNQGGGAGTFTSGAASAKSLAREPSELGSILEEPEIEK